MGQESAVPGKKWVSKQWDGHQAFCNYALFLTDVLKKLDTGNFDHISNYLFHN